MPKPKMHTPDLVAQNIEWVAARFPGCITESRNEKGEVIRSVDVDLLRQELSNEIVEGPQERYHLNWPGKREALLAANAAIAKTLRPCREEGVNVDATRNLFIEGDNLDALKLLQETYLSQVKMIYIDPPYNTGNQFLYKDDFAQTSDEYMTRSLQRGEHGERFVANPETSGRRHSDWLSLMLPRLRLARNLLKTDGVICISIDDNEIGNLRKLCDEVFGADNFIATIVWQKRYVSNVTAKWLSDMHDYILVYGRDRASVRFGDWARTEEQEAAYKNPDGDPRGVWRAQDLSASKPYSAGMFTITGPTGKTFEPPPNRYWRCNEIQFNKWREDNRIWWGVNGDARPMLKAFLEETEGGITPHTWWDYSFAGHNKEATLELKALFDGSAPFDTPKPVKLMRRLLELCTGDGDLVLDFFAGSATLAHAVLELNATDGMQRRFIMIQAAEPCGEASDAYRNGWRTIADVGKERVRRASAKIVGELGLASSKLDAGFRVLKVDSSNMKDVYYRPDEATPSLLGGHVDNIKDDRTDEDLLFQVLLDWGVDLSLPIAKETIAGRPVYFVDKDALAACFASGVNEDLVKALAARKPLRVVFRDAGYGGDDVKINVEQIFKQLSPGTEVKTL
jgi:adenine-specific DNA-methyltransferase